MIDTEQKRIEAICKAAHVDDISDLSDGYHTFKQLYYQRMMLFAALVKQNRGKAWKSLRHEDGELCFGGGWFIVGIDTPEGSYTYHYEDNYFSLFDCVELERGKHWDGHTEKDVTRLLSLEQETCSDVISRQVVLDTISELNVISFYEAQEDSKECYYEIRNVIKQVPPVKQEQKWIPCSEMLPEKSGAYWCTFGGTNLTGSDYYTTESDAKEFFVDPEEYAGWRSQNVIAWMPLPLSYKPD